MKTITKLELLLINGGLNYLGITVNVENPNIPERIFNEIDYAYTQLANGNWDYSYMMVYLCAEGRLRYHNSYKSALMTALWEAGFYEID